MASTVGGRDAAIEPQGWGDGVLTKGNAPAFSFSEPHCLYRRDVSPMGSGCSPSPAGAAFDLCRLARSRMIISSIRWPFFQADGGAPTAWQNHFAACDLYAW